MIKPQRLPGSSGVRTTGILIAVVFVLYMAREILIPLSFAMMAIEFTRFLVRRENFLGSLTAQAQE